MPKRPIPEWPPTRPSVNPQSLPLEFAHIGQNGPEPLRTCLGPPEPQKRGYFDPFLDPILTPILTQKWSQKKGHFGPLVRLNWSPKMTHFWVKNGSIFDPFWGPKRPLFDPLPGTYLAKSACTQTNPWKKGSPGPQKWPFLTPFWAKNDTHF